MAIPLLSEIIVTTTRRRFIESAAANAAALALLPGTMFAAMPEDFVSDPSADEWDIAWPDKLRGKYKAVFDMTEPESGFGVWRAAFWANQYMDVMKAAPADLSPVLIIRHNAIFLAMQQSFWDKYNIGEVAKINHPLTGDVAKRNPVLLDERDGLQAPFASMGLHKQLARGATALACNLALRLPIQIVQRTDKVSPEAARKVVVESIVPGVILQPSGVFAAIRAQGAGAAYIHAS